MAVLDQSDMWAHNNVIKTSSVFVESCRDSDTPVMCLEKDRKGLPCLRTFYIQYCVEDASEVEFADAVFGDFQYWQQLKKAKWFLPYLEEWQEEVDVRRKSKAFKAIVKEVDEGGKNAITAAKFLIQEPYKGRTVAARKKVSKTTDTARGDFAADVIRLKAYTGDSG
jgi:hypothetical protein